MARSHHQGTAFVREEFIYSGEQRLALENMSEREQNKIREEIRLTGQGCGHERQSVTLLTIRTQQNENGKFCPPFQS